MGASSSGSSTGTPGEWRPSSSTTRSAPGGSTTPVPVRFATIPARSPAALLDLDGDGHLDVVALARDPVGVSSRLVLARNICGPGPGTTTLFLPAFLSLTGAEATRFETEVAVTNFGTSPVSAVLRLHPPESAPRVDLASFTLEPGRVRMLSTTDDAEAERLVLPEGIDRGTATLEISTRAGSSPDVVADVRVLSQRPGEGRGGVGLRARPADLLQVGSAGDVAWLDEDVEDRTNLAVASAGADPVTLRVSVFSSDPERPGRVTLPDVTLVPYGSYQWNRVLAASGLGARRGWARVERLAGGPWTAWATVNSNGTGDGSVIEASAAGWETFLPAIVGTDRYRTDVVLTNTTTSSRIASLRLPPVSGVSPLALDLEVEAESSRLVDPVAALRDAHLIPPGPYVGHATVGPALLAGARVTTDPSAPSGSFGVYTPAARFSWGETMLAPGLRQDGRNRSNLAIVVRELEPPSRFRVELFDGRTGALAKTIEEVAPGTTAGAPSRIQLDSVLAGAPEFPSAGRASCGRPGGARSSPTPSSTTVRRRASGRETGRTCRGFRGRSPGDREQGTSGIATGPGPYDSPFGAFAAARASSVAFHFAAWVPWPRPGLGLVPRLVERDESPDALLVPGGDAGRGREHAFRLEELRLGLAEAPEAGEAAAQPLPGFGGRPEGLALCPFVHFGGFAEARLGLGGVAALQEQATQVQEVGRGARVAAGVEAPSHRQRLAEERLGRHQVAALLDQEREVVEAGRHVRMVAREEPSPHLERLARQRLGSREVATVLENAPTGC